MKITLLPITLLLAVSFAYANPTLARMKEEQKKTIEENIPVNEKQEEAIYRWFKDNLYDFQSLEIIEWGSRFSKASLTTDKGDWYVAVKFKSNSQVGNKVIAVKVFLFSESGHLKNQAFDTQMSASTDLNNPFGKLLFGTKMVYLPNEPRKPSK